MHNVSGALAAELADHGREIRVNSGLKNIAVEKGGAVAVRLDDGEVIALDGVLASNVDPRRLALELLGEAQIGEAVVKKIKCHDWGHSLFGIYLALDGPVPIAPDPRPIRQVTSISESFARRPRRD